MITPGHFALGMGIGTAITLPGLAKAWASGQGLAGATGRMLVFAYGVALFAIIPNLVSFAGMGGLARSPVMNVFLLNPWLAENVSAGKLISGAALLFGMAFHYVVLLLALRRAQAVRHSQTPPQKRT